LEEEGLPKISWLAKPKDVPNTIENEVELRVFL